MEERLRALPAAPVPETLDRRVAATLGAGAPAPLHPAARPVPLWLCASACMFCLIAGMGLARMTHSARAVPPTSTKVFLIGGGDRFSALLAGKREPTEFFLRKKQILSPPPTSPTERRSR